ncbi:MAG TPA: DUF177 domain-containing protein [Chloroflexota bacterium]
MSLLFNVSQLLKSEIGQSRTYDFEGDEPLDLGDATASDIRGHVKFVLTNFGIVTGIHAEATLHLTCARCLEPFDTPASADFEEEYVPSIDIQTGLPSTTPRSDTAMPISANHVIDLSDAIRQQLVLAVDLIPVCKQDCRGLCPTCGVNLNIETCLCPPVEAASPFAALRGLLQEAETDR